MKKKFLGFVICLITIVGFSSCWDKPEYIEGTWKAAGQKSDEGVYVEEMLELSVDSEANKNIVVYTTIKDGQAPIVKKGTYSTSLIGGNDLRLDLTFEDGTTKSFSYFKSGGVLTLSDSVNKSDFEHFKKAAE